MVEIEMETKKGRKGKNLDLILMKRIKAMFDLCIQYLY